MRPEDLATLHAAAFSDSRSWSAKEFSDLLSSPFVFVIAQHGGFALGRAIADEAELLTIAVQPNQRRQGLGKTLLKSFERESQTRGATRVFLEVAADNAAAIALYATQTYAVCGHRPNYYTRNDGTQVDACLMDKPLI